MSLILIKGAGAKLRRTELVRHYMETSDVNVYVLDQEPLHVYIEVRGELAHLPNIKNATNPQGGLTTPCEAKLLALTAMYDRHMSRLPWGSLSFGRSRVLCVLLCAERSQSFDPIGCLESVQDWLEPATKVVGRKNKRYRGWGCGLIENDSQVAFGAALHSRDAGPAVDFTRIIIRSWAAAAPRVAEFVATQMLPDSAMAVLECFRDKGGDNEKNL